VLRLLVEMRATRYVFEVDIIFPIFSV